MLDSSPGRCKDDQNIFSGDPYVMRFLGFAICLALCPAIFSLTKQEAQQIYDTDSKKIRAGDLSFDWKEYRLAAATSDQGFDWHPIRTRFMQQLNQGDMQGALKSAAEIKNHDMAQPEGHLLAMIALKKLGRDQDAAFEHKVVEAYLQSITSSGDGRSSETAYFVVSEDEEYFFINIVMGVGLPESQSLVQRNGHSFDLLKIKDKDGSVQEIWFNVDTSMARLKEALRN
jgi:Domain of unknown function (DUF4919)